MALTKVRGSMVNMADLDLSNVGAIQADSIAGDADTNTSITFSGSDVITIANAGTNQLTFNDGSIVPVTDDDIDLGTSVLEFKNAYFDGTVTSDAFAGPLTGAVTGNADTATALATARTIGGTSFDGTANIAVGLAATATALATARTIGGTSFDGTANIAVGLAGTATALATARTIAMTGDVVWSSGSFDGSGNVTAAATIQTDAIDIAMLSASGTASSSTFLRGDNTWTAVSTPITALNNATANELVTVGSTTTELEAESALTFDGSNLTLGTGAAGHEIRINKSDAGSGTLRFQSAGTMKSYDSLDASEDRVYYSASGTDHIFYSHGTELMRLVSGKVGIGTGTPGALLHLYNSSNAQITFQNSTTGTSIGSDGYDITVQGNDAYHILRDSGFQTWYTANTRRMTLDSGGKLGIGTTTPSYPLEVVLGNGNLAFFGGASSNSVGQYCGIGLGLVSNATNYQKIALVQEGRDNGNYISDFHILVDISADGNSAVLSDKKLSISGADGSIYFGAALPTTATNGDIPLLMRDSDGQIVQDSVVYNCAEDKLTVGGGTFITSAYIRSGVANMQLGTASTGPTFTLTTQGRQCYNTSSTDSGHANFVGEVGSNMKAVMFERTNGGGEVGSIVANVSSTSYNTSSDYRLKENVDYTWDATTRLKQLKPARFNWIVDDTNTLLEGFLAHEVSDIVPEAVSGEKDAEDMQGIDQSKLVPLMIKTIQEQQTTIEELSTKVDAAGTYSDLEQRIQDIEQRLV